MPRCNCRSSGFHRHNGFSYIELMVAVAIGSILMGALIGVVYTASATHDDIEQRNQLARDARFAMARMVDMLSHSSHLLLPLRDNPATNWPEHIREQTRPASPPIGDSTLATAVLAMTLPAHIDQNNDGVADADNDGDGRIDEDLPGDNNDDGEDGIFGIDDDGDGSIDEHGVANNDEQGTDTDDPINGLDDDGDGSIDEDINQDMNTDGFGGISGVDDDGDSLIDETGQNNDDEDGSSNEDWYDSVVYFMSGDNLIERLPVPRDVNADSTITGEDYVESKLTDYVSRLRFERVEDPGLRHELVDITLELTHPVTGSVFSLQTRVRLGAAL